MPSGLPEPVEICPSCGGEGRAPDGRCAGCQTDLDGACDGCGAPMLRFARFCWACGAASVGRPAALARTGATRASTGRRPVTAMFCDLVGSAALSVSMPPEDFGHVLRAYHRLTTEAVASYGGFIASYMGDGALAYFGYPQAGEDDAERAIRSALEIARTVPTVTALGQPMQVRVGIAAGVVVTGDIVGVRGPRGLEVAGEAPNLAARLQTVAEPGEVVVDAAVRALAGRLFEFAHLGEVVLKGWTDGVSAWKVAGPGAPPGEPFARTAGLRLPLVGRDAEWERLSAAWRDAQAGRDRTVAIVGEMGIGKSRLVAELLRAAADAPHARLDWFCSRYLQGVALHPIVRQIERTAGLATDDPSPLRRAKLDAFLADASELDRGLIAELIAPGAALPSVAGLSPNKRRDLTLAALLATMRARAGQRPTLAVFEDYHWADHTSRDLLALAAGGASPLRGLLVVTVRPGSEPDWIERDGVELIQLDALQPDDAKRLAVLAASTSLPGGTLDGIVARCDGVPLFIEEVTRAVTEAEPTEGARAGRGAPMPLSIRASLMSRLDSLGDARETAEAASVIGREFGTDLLAQVMERPSEELRADLDRMVASGLVRADGEGAGGGFRFRHALIQDAAYDSVVRERRRSLHGRIAVAIRDLTPAMAETQPQLLATHFTEAGDAEQAVGWWLAAAGRSLQQSAVAEALDQIRRGLEVLQTQPDDEGRRRTEMALLILKAKAHVEASGHGSDPVGASFRRARALSEQLPGAPQRLTVTFGEWSYLVTRGPLAQAAEAAASIRTLAEQSGDPIHAMFGFYTSGLTDTHIGRFASAADFVQRGLDACSRVSRDAYGASVVGDPRSIMRAYAGFLGMVRGNVGSCRRDTALALREARETKLSYSIAHALLIAVVNEAFGGVPDEGDGDLDALQGFARDRGMAFFETIERPLRGWAIARRGDTEAGLGLLRDGLARYRDTQSGVWVWAFLRMQAEVLGWRGLPEEGLVVLQEAEQAALSAGSEFEAAIVPRVRGELLARIGRIGEAEQALAGAVAIGRERGAHLFARQAADARRRLRERLGGPPVDEAAAGLLARDLAP